MFADANVKLLTTDWKMKGKNLVEMEMKELCCYFKKTFKKKNKRKNIKKESLLMQKRVIFNTPTLAFSLPVC